jgi:tripartite-type tricarboxylate transporter receptor subunit TctC
MRAFISLLLALAASPAAAQDVASFPSRPIRIVVPFPAGGPTDINARIIAQRMSEDWRQPVVIENRPGGNTAIGAQVVAKAEPDGYTLLAAMDTTLVMNPATAAAPLSYDPFRDFATITLTAKNTSLLTVRAADGPASVQELIARARQNPGKLNYGAGIITTRLAGYLFARSAGIRVQMIPYKGSADVVAGLLSGSVDFIVDGVAASLPLIKGGRLRALAKLNRRPLPVLPDLPPLADAAGLPELADMSSWIGLVAPAGTPAGVIDKIAREVATIYADPVVAARLEQAGITAATSTPAEFDAFFRAEAKRWTQVFRESGIRLE